MIRDISCDTISFFDGEPPKDGNQYFVADNSRGYWNFCVIEWGCPGGSNRPSWCMNGNRYTGSITKWAKIGNIK